MLWFKHRSDARNSLKLRKLRRKYGANGYAIYWFCLEAIAYDVDKDNLTFELKEDAETIGFELSVQESLVMEIMQYMVKIGLFESSSNMITCMKLAESMDKSMTNSPKMRKWLDGKKLPVSHNVMTCADDAKTCAELEVELELELEVELEVEKEVEVEKRTSIGSKLPSINSQQVVDAYHEILPMMASIQVLNDKRKTAIRNFFKKRSSEKGSQFTLDNFRSYLGYIATNCQWMTVDRPNGRGGFWKAKNFDYILKDDCYISVKEKRFDNMENN